jgi:hypothetical protein
MVEKLIKYRVFLIIIVLLFSTILIQPPFHGDYYGIPPVHLYFLVTLFNLLVYLIPTEKLIFGEKLIYAAIISCVVLIGGGMFVGLIMRLIYGSDSNWDELKSPALLDTALFYFSSNFGGIGLFALWLKYKKPIYS